MTDEARDEFLRRCALCDGPVTVLEPFENSSKVLHCLQCGTETIRPFPSPDEIHDHYKDYSVTDTPETQLLFLIDLCVQAITFYLNKMNAIKAADAYFMEIGFGNGASLLAASKLGFSTAGIDLDAARVDGVKSLSQKYNIPIDAREGDVLSLSQFGSQFDVVKVSQVLEHVLDPMEFLRNVSNHQKVGGYLIIESPNNEAAFWHIKNKARKLFNRMHFYNSLKLKEHLWGYTKKSLPLLLKKAGYEVVFMTDYASGNPIFEPQSVLWYPKWQIGIKELTRRGNSLPLIYSTVRFIDGLSSRLFGMGTGLAVLARKMTKEVKAQ